MFMLTTVKRKLLAMSLVSTGAALIAACGVLAAYDYISFKQVMVTDTRTYADVVGGNCTAAISFNDANDASQILESLRAEPHILAACLYDRNGARFATYFRKESVPLPANPNGFDQGYRFGSGWLDVVGRVTMNGQQIGSIYVRSDLVALAQREHRYFLVFGGLLLGAMGLALVLSSRLSRHIVGPVQNLSRAATAVTKDHDYSTRAAKSSDDELGMLVDCFNAMLDQIQTRDGQLTMHKEHLEEMVAARTEELTAAKHRAEEASRAKTAFLANMSHEIRTPMTAILGYADLMLSPVQTMSDRINSLQVVRRNARHLMDLINDILDISKIEAERMTVEKIPCDIARIVAEVTSTMRGRALAKNLTLRAEFVGGIPDVTRTDPLRLKQVLINLVGNAIKFTHHGEVCLKVRIESDKGTSRAVFDVSDTGIGIKPDQVDKLFQPFVQADESMTRKYGGSGLGLVISKRLAKYMGGDLTVKSSPGVGTTFTFWIDGGPLEGAQMRQNLTESMLTLASTPQESEEIKLKGRILLAEDGIDNQHLLTTHLTMAGAEVVLAENGRIAVEKTENERFDLILMDMQMPEMDGYTAARELRRRGWRLPIIALTAHAMSGDRAKCLDAGCTDYLTKPIDKDLLLRTIDGYLPKSANVPGGAPATPPPPPPTPTAKVDAVEAAMKNAVAGFVTRLPARVDSLLGLLKANDLAELQRLVHQLKGVGGGYGFPGITTHAAEAEASLKANADLDKIRAQVNELVQFIRAINGYDPSKETFSEKQAANH